MGWFACALGRVCVCVPFLRNDSFCEWSSRARARQNNGRTAPRAPTCASFDGLTVRAVRSVGLTCTSYYLDFAVKGTRSAYTSHDIQLSSLILYDPHTNHWSVPTRRMMVPCPPGSVALPVARISLRQADQRRMNVFARAGRAADGSRASAMRVVLQKRGTTSSLL